MTPNLKCLDTTIDSVYGCNIFVGILCTSCMTYDTVVVYTTRVHKQLTRGLHVKRDDFSPGVKI